MTNTTTITVETVTPEIAEQMLGKNTHNRNLKAANLNGLVADMKAGNWQFNGEPIKFAKDGTLIDGQHRLTAIVKAGIPQEMLIVRGLEMKSQHTMDAGSTRSTADALKLRGEKNYGILASGIKASILWERGVRKTLGGNGGGNHKVTTSQILDYLEAHPECREYARFAARYKARIELPSSTLFLLWKVFSEIDYVDAEVFFDRLASHLELQGSPIYALDRALTEANSGNVRRSSSWRIAMTIKAWNKFRAGEQVRILRYSPGGAAPEQFPEPI